MPGSGTDQVSVLHVDDDPALTELTAQFLERRRDHFEVTSVTDPGEAVDRVTDADVDCVVSDHDMPGMNGLELLGAIREIRPDLPFILFTGKGSEEIASEAISKGATDYLQKRSDSDQYELLANRIDNAVEQRRAQRELERRERRLHALFENSNDRLSVLDDEGRYQFVSPAMERLMGRDPAELLGESAFEYIHPDDRAGAKAAFGAIVRNPSEIHSVEYRFRHADGSWRWVESRGKNLLDDPAVGGIVINSRNVTARKERERKLEEARARFYALTDNTTLAVLTIDDESRIQYANEAVEDLFGYGSDELVDESLLTIMPERFHDAHEAGISRYLQGGARQLDWEWVELPGQRKDGSEVPLGISFGEAEVNGEHRFTAAIRDISDRKARERERTETLELLRDLYDVTTDTELDFEDKIDVLLELGCERLGISIGFLSRIDTDDASDERDTQRIVRAHGDHALLQPGESCPLSEAYCRKTIRSDGLLAIDDAVQAGMESDPAYDRFELGSYIGGKVIANGQLYGTICFADAIPREGGFTDTERTIVRLMSRWISYELESQRMTAELERQNERLQEFASILAHDLRNPLNVANGRLEMAAAELEETEDLDTVADALDRMDTLIDDVLALAREGQTVTETAAVDLAETVEQAWETVETTDATLEVDTDRTIYADRSRLRQLLENLVRNSVEHGGSDVTITVGDREDGFYLADDGPGIPADERDEVFETGYTTSTDGTGFGLSIVEEIATAHDWRIAAGESRAGGAKFAITNVDFADE